MLCLLERCLQFCGSRAGAYTLYHSRAVRLQSMVQTRLDTPRTSRTVKRCVLLARLDNVRHQKFIQRRDFSHHRYSSGNYYKTKDSEHFQCCATYFMGLESSDNSPGRSFVLPARNTRRAHAAAVWRRHQSLHKTPGGGNKNWQ
jgi:hypothetical protein